MGLLSGYGALSVGYKMAPKIWNFISELCEGAENKILDETLSQLSAKTDINKSDLKQFLLDSDKKELNQDEEVIIESFYNIFYENMLKHPDFSKKLEAEKMRLYESLLGDIKNFLENKDDIKLLKEKYVSMIRYEIESCIGILEQDYVQILPDRWLSTSNSEAIKYLEDAELEILSNIYNIIINFNERAKENRFAGIQWEVLRNERGYRFPLMRVKEFLKIRDNLYDKLKDLKEKMQ